MKLSYQFTTDYDKILEQLYLYNPEKYAETRNYLNGGITYFSPYISRGVLSTKRVYDSLLERGFQPKKLEKLIQELAWRDYWQQLWIAKGSDILDDLRQKQQPVKSNEMPLSIVNGQTGITAIDAGIQALKGNGYMHNHLRMYVASIFCNVAYTHWKQPAKWMYYYLLDADLASNHLSWQWVAGSNANKKYVANQDNINKFFGTTDQHTFLDIDYEDFEKLEQPKQFAETIAFHLKTNLPEVPSLTLYPECSTYIYNFYNIDIEWGKDKVANRILLLEPSIFEKFPIAEHSLNFAIKLARNIQNIQVFVGEFDEFIYKYKLTDIYYKEHPLNQHYKGKEYPRDWLTDVTGYYPSFFKFWNKAKKQLL